MLGGMEKLQRGDAVFAVYPDTTSFYQASVVQAPRKVGAGEAFVMVNFVDDADEQGVYAPCHLREVKGTSGRKTESSLL